MPRTSRSTEVSCNEECPCGKGRVYGECCSKRAVKWVRNPDGGYSKEIPLSPGARKAIKEAKKAFKSIFGRPMRRTDRLFPFTYIESLSDTRRATHQMLMANNFEPEFIYAYLKTGLIATKPENLTTVQVEQYTAAIGEFFQFRKQGASVKDLINPDTPERILTDALRNVLLICAYLVEEYINAHVLNGRGSTNAELDFAVSCAFVNFVKSLRSVLVLLDNGISYDANYLVRSLYENYLRIKYMYLDPSRAAQILGFDAAESFDSEKEKLKLRKPPPFKNMAQAIGELELFEGLYGELSQIAHSQSVTMKHLINDESYFDFANVNSDFELSTLLTAHGICARTLDCMYDHCSCPKHFKNDLLTALKRSFGALLIGWGYLSKVDNHQMTSSLAEFIEQLTKRHPSLRMIKEELAEMSCSIS